MPARIEGLAELWAVLENLPGDFVAVVVPTIETGAAIIESEARARVPYDEGDLERSIETSMREDGLRAAIGADEFYAAFAELGTEDTPAQPYLYPAFRIGARYVRREMRGWGREVGKTLKLRTKRRRQ